MTRDDVDAATIDLPGGPVQLASTQAVLHRVPYMAGTLQVGFTPNGPGDIPTSKDPALDQAAGADEHATDPITAETYINHTHVALDAEDWRNMGSPDQITVTVEPGDTLSHAHPSPGMGDVTDIHHIPGRTPDDVAALIRHKPVDPTVDTRPRHDDVTSTDVRVEQHATKMTVGDVATVAVERRSV